MVPNGLGNARPYGLAMSSSRRTVVRTVLQETLNGYICPSRLVFRKESGQVSS